MRLFKTAFGLLFIIIIITGCLKDPFSTRDSEDPYGSVGTWETPQSPEVTVRNLINAYNEKIITNYRLCLANTFVFSSPEDSIDAVNDGRFDLFANWDYSVESAVTNNIFLTYSGSDSLNYILVLNASEEYNDVVDDTSAVLYRDYVIRTITHTDPAPDTVNIEGLATFHLYQEQLNWWTIYLWEDIPKIPGQDDWGDFKALFR